MSDGAMARTRLDAFVDAAFAFAVTLLVAGGGQAISTAEGLSRVAGEAPAFLMSFALIAMFWHAHVRWRDLRGEGSGLSVLLSLALVFLVLIYVHPLRLLSLSVTGLMGLGPAVDFGREQMRDLFAFYGLGFLLLAGVTALLFRGAMRAAEAGTGAKAVATGEAVIWSMLAISGLISATIAGLTPATYAAPWIYAVLPLAVGLFAWRHRWTPKEA